MRYFSILLTFLVSCTAAKVSVPDKFQAASTSMKVSGLNGWMINQQLQFGEYSTTSVKRGWDFSSMMQHSRISFRLEDQLVKVFNVGMDDRSISEKNKMQYSISHGNMQAGVFAMEKFSEKQIVYKAPDPRWGELTHSKGYQYAFSAAIVLMADQQPEPWQLVLVNRNDEEEGYASNGDLTIGIKSLRIGNYTNPKGKEVKIVGGPMFAGYELTIDKGVIGVVDMLDNRVIMINDMDPAYKLVTAAVSSALMLKRKQDPGN
jgi:hypothetical protein